MADPVTLPAGVLDRYPRFSLFNSPYPAHDEGCAIDLYPDSNAGLSPVAGEVLDTRTVGCPSRDYAVDHDHLVVVAVDHDWAARAGVDPGTVARILHVDPDVSAGDRVAVGDSLGEMVRSGFFGQWVDNHVHLGFRAPDADPYRASGSLPVRVGVDVTGVRWDGTGTVVETGDTYALLDSPAHPGDGWAAVADDDGRPLDGGLVHYSGGGLLGGVAGGDTDVSGAVSLLGTAVGDVETGGLDGRGVAWRDVAVVANGVRATGLSLFASQSPFGAKLVFHGGHEFAVGDDVEVAVEPTDSPIRLG